jgi:hypothetical protein
MIPSNDWRRLGTGKRYVTTRPMTAYGQTIPAGFVFQVSVPNWFQRNPNDLWWARALKWFLPIDPHDPAWLWASLWHDWALKQGWSTLRASALMARAQADSFRWWRWWWIPPTFVATLIVTTLSPPLRRVFSWALGSGPRPNRDG